MIYNTFATDAAYNDFARRLLGKVEGDHTFVYADTRSIPTISVGVTFGSYGADILNEMGVSQTSPYYQQLLTTGKAAGGTAKFTTLLRAYDASVGRVFDASNEISSAGDDRLFAKAFQHAKDITLAAFGAIPESKELAVIVSLEHNGALGVTGRNAARTTKFKKAITDGNRSDAWFIIRYGMDNVPKTDISPRRYYESEQFGLYDNRNSVGIDEAIKVYATFSDGTNFSDALKYEQAHGSRRNLKGPVEDLPSELAPAISAVEKKYGLTEKIDYRNIFVSQVDHSGIIAPPLLSGSPANSTHIVIGQGSNETLSAIGSSKSVLISRGGEATLKGGASETVEINDSGNSATFYNGTGPTLMVGGSGQDNFHIDASKGAVVVYGGGGDDNYYIDGGKNVQIHNIVSNGPVTNAWLEQEIDSLGGAGAGNVYVVNAGKGGHFLDAAGNALTGAARIQISDQTKHFVLINGHPVDIYVNQTTDTKTYAYKTGEIWYSPDIDDPSKGTSDFASGGNLEVADQSSGQVLNFSNFANGDLGIALTGNGPTSTYTTFGTGGNGAGDSGQQLASNDFFNYVPTAAGNPEPVVAAATTRHIRAADAASTDGGSTVLTGTGNDTFSYSLSDGNVEIDETDTSAVPSNVLALGDGIDPAQVIVEGDVDGNLSLLFGGDSQVRLKSALNSTSGITYGVQQITFSDGTVWTAADLLARSLEADSSKSGLFGGSEADTIDSGGLVDTVSGGGGGDTFVFNRGYGYLSIAEADHAAAPDNVLRLGADIIASDVSVSADEAGNIYLSIGDTDQVELVGALNSDATVTYGVQSVSFADGTLWSYADLLAKALTPVSEADGIFGDASANLLDTQGLVSLAQGGGGGDTFVYNSGYGDLTISEDDTGASTNLLQLGTGIDPASVTVTSSGNGDIELELSDGSTITIAGGLTSSASDRVGVQQITFADGTTWTYTDLLNRLLTPSAGSYGIYGDATANVIDTQGLTDYASGGGGGDTFVYDASYGDLTIDERDTIAAPNNVLAFGTGILPSDVTVSGDEAGDLLLSVGGHTITLTGALLSDASGVQTVTFANGTTWTRADLLTKSLVPSAGAEGLFGDAGANTLDTQGQVHFVNGGGGGDTFVYQRGYGALTLEETDSADVPDNVLDLGAGIAPSDLSISGTAGGDIVVDLGDGDVITLVGMLQSAAGLATGVQQINFADGSVWTAADLVQAAGSAGGGKSTIYGDIGANVLDTGGTAQIAVGNGGGDTFLYNQGYGHVVIDETDSAGIANNVLRFGDGISASQISVSQNADGDIILSLDGDDDVTLTAALLDDSEEAYGVQTVQFADGTSWDIDQLQSFATGVFSFAHGAGTVSFDEALNPASGSPVIEFGGGITPENVHVVANEDGSISIDAGDGDILTLENGSTSNNQTFEFADGTIWQWADLTAQTHIGSPDTRSLYGTSAAETFDSRGLAQLISGGGGGDTILYDQGYGNLTIDESDTSAAPNNKIVFGAGIDPAAIHVSGDSDGNIILTLDGDDRITLLGALSSTQGDARGVQQLQFADGTLWTMADLVQRSASAAGGNVELYGDGTANTFDPAGVAHYISGGGGGDAITYQRGDGALTIDEVDSGQYPDNTLVFGAGITPDDVAIQQQGEGSDAVIDLGNGDVITLSGQGGAYGGSNSGIQKIQFADGTVEYLPFTLFGGSSGETLDPQGRASAIVGTKGGDTILYQQGYGSLSIDETQATGSVASTLAFGAGIAAADVSASIAGGGNLVLDLGNGDQITIQSAFTQTPGGAEPIGQITFADGTVWSYADLVQIALTPKAGTSGIADDAVGHTLDTQGLVSQIFANGGGDTIVYKPGYGFLSIYETDLTSAPSNSLILGTGINPSNVTVVGSGTSLSLQIAGGGQIFLNNELDRSETATYGVQSVQFADGTVWTYADLLEKALHPTQAYGTVTGDTNANLIDTQGAFHSINGNGGGDTIVYDTGYGSLSIQDGPDIDPVQYPWESLPSNPNILSFGSDISPSDVIASINNGNIQLAMPDGSIISETGINEFHFSDGTVWTYESIWNQANVASSTNTTLWGRPNLGETFDPSGLADTIQGQGGGDTIIYKQGYGSVTVYEPVSSDGSAGDNRIEFGDGVDPSAIEVSNDGQMTHIFTGVPGDEVSFYNGSIEHLSFSDGTVWTAADLAQAEIKPSENNTNLVGSTPGLIYDPEGIATSIQGAGGGDRIIYNRGYGALTINDMDSTDQPNTLVLGPGISPDDVVASWISGDGGNGGGGPGPIGIFAVRALGNNNPDFDPDDVSNANILLSFGGNDQITLTGVAQGSPGIEYGVDRIEFADGTVWTYQDLLAHANMPSSSNTTLIGDLGANDFDPDGVANEIIGQGGGDTVHYDRGYGPLTLYDENVIPSATPNILAFAEGIAPSDVTVIGNSDWGVQFSLGGDDVVTVPDSRRNDSNIDVRFADGTIWSSADILRLADTGAPGKTQMVGTVLDDTFDSKGYTDYISGDDGSDTYLFDRGYGSLTIDDHGYIFNNNTFELSDINIVKFAAGISASDVTVSRYGENLVLTLDRADRVVVNGQFAVEGPWDSVIPGIQGVQFADGTSWSVADLLAMVNAPASGTPATVDQSSGVSATANLPVDTDDTLGASGTFTFTDPDLGDVHKASVITAYSLDGGDYSAPSAADLMSYFSASVQTDASGEQSGGLAWAFNAPSSAFDYLAPGASAHIDYVVEISDQNHALVDQDVVVTIQSGLNGNSGTVHLSGTSGDDYITLPASNFIVTPGQGNDQLYAEDDGSGVIDFAKGDGNDALDDVSTWLNRSDILQLTDSNPDEISLAKSGDALTVQIDATGDTFEADQQFSNADPNLGVNEIVFADGTTWDRNEIANRVNSNSVSMDTPDQTYDASDGPDTFVLSNDMGHASISSLDLTSAQHDYIEVNRNMFSDWAHLLGATQQQGSDLVINVDGSNGVNLAGVSLASFTQRDVKFTS